MLVLVFKELFCSQDQAPDYQQEYDRHQEITSGGEVQQRLLGKVCPEDGLKGTQGFMNCIRLYRMSKGFRQGDHSQVEAKQ